MAARAALVDGAGSLLAYIDRRSAGDWGRLLTLGRFALQETWTFAGRVLPFYINVVAEGYRLERHGDIVIARGRRLLEPGLLREWILRGRLPGTRYLLPNARVEEELWSFTAGGGLPRVGRAAWKAVSHDAWEIRETLSVLRRGGGLPAMLLSLGPDVWDYGWGTRRGEGLLSSGFVSTIATDVSVSLGEMAVSAAAGAAVGSLGCPVAGTAVGFGTGLVLGAVVEFTPGGRGARNAVQRAVKQEIESTVESGRQVMAANRRRMYPGFPGGDGPSSPWSYAGAMPG